MFLDNGFVVPDRVLVPCPLDEQGVRNVGSPNRMIFAQINRLQKKVLDGCKVPRLVVAMPNRHQH